MNWTTCTVFFPARFFEENSGVWEFRTDALEEFFTRYLHDTTSEAQILDGVEVTLSPAERDTFLATIYRDDDPLTRSRKASLFDGTLTPVGEPLSGFAIHCGWPEPFLNELSRDPQPEPDLFDGVYVT